MVPLQACQQRLRPSLATVPLVTAFGSGSSTHRPWILPSSLVLENDDVPGLKQCLDGQQIYCPIPWPPSEVVAQTGNWPDRYISLPIDHRYSEPDMMRLAACIRTFFSENQQRPTT